MRAADFLRRNLGRRDAQSVLVVAGLLLLAVALQGLMLYAYVAVESLEEADHWVQYALQGFPPRVARGESPASVADDLRRTLGNQSPAVRLRGIRGELLDGWGRWPAADRQVPVALGDDERTLGAFRLLEPENYLVGQMGLSSGTTVELALPLAHFVSEAAEMARAIGLVTLGSGLFAILIALIATRRAFAPLRQATALLGNVDARHLGRRLPTRGTADPVDCHAEVLNRALSTIDSSFARLRAFSSNAAHELRTPLHRIGNVAEVALLRGAAEDLRPALESVHATSQELSRLIQSLLLLAELDDERFVLKRSPVDARTLIARSAEIYGPLFEERGMKLSVCSDAASIEGDPLLLDRVLANLLDNALRHAPPGGQVEIQGVRAEAGFRISVDDTGTGVPSEERERIFDRFARLEGTRDGPGAGLGLALARGIARVHGGDLTMEDSPLLGGSRFVWWLPGRGRPQRG